MNKKPGFNKRTVGIETVIPTIYRSYKENFKVIFLDSLGNALNFYKYKFHGENKEYNRIDTKETSVGVGDEKEFIDGIFYNKFEGGNKTAFEQKYNVEVTNVSGKTLFDYLKDKKMTEDIGIYYQEDLSEATRGELENRKNEKRVITYTVQP